MKTARKLWFPGDFSRAHKILQAAMPRRTSPRSHQTLVDLKLRIPLPGGGKVEGHRRELDLDRAVASVTFKAGGITIYLAPATDHTDAGSLPGLKIRNSFPELGKPAENSAVTDRISNF